MCDTGASCRAIAIATFCGKPVERWLSQTLLCFCEKKLQLRLTARCGLTELDPHEREATFYTKQKVVWTDRLQTDEHFDIFCRWTRLHFRCEQLWSEEACSSGLHSVIRASVLFIQFIHHSFPRMRLANLCNSKTGFSPVLNVLNLLRDNPNLFGGNNSIVCVRHANFHAKRKSPASDVKPQFFFSLHMLLWEPKICSRYLAWFCEKEVAQVRVKGENAFHPQAGSGDPAQPGRENCHNRRVQGLVIRNP